MFSKWGGRSDDRIREIIDNLFVTRFWDLSTCGGCGQQTAGIFAPEGHEGFYCRKCWIKYLKEADDKSWQEWNQWTPDMPKVPSENSRQHELKCVLLALSRFGGSITFPPSLSSFERMKMHTFCEREPELKSLHKKSYGDGKERFFRVSSMDDDRAIVEARAVLHGEVSKAAGSSPEHTPESGKDIEEVPTRFADAFGQQLDSLPLARLRELQRELAAAQQRIGDEITRRAGDVMISEKEVDDITSAKAQVAAKPKANVAATPKAKVAAAKTALGDLSLAQEEAAQNAQEEEKPAKTAKEDTERIEAAKKEEKKIEAAKKEEKRNDEDVDAQGDFPALGFPALSLAAPKKKGGKKAPRGGASQH